MIDTAPWIDAWMSEHQVELLAFLRRLIQIPSEVIPPRGYEMACQQFVADAYRAAGAEVDIFTPDEVPGLREHPAFYPTWDGMPRNFVNRPDVVGIFRGAGGGRSVLFSAHVDTVTAGDLRAWKAAGPFSGSLIDGKVYGRGAWDTKAGIAIGLFAARCALSCARELGRPLRGDVLVESVSDEEFGGSHGTLAARLRGHNADIAINAEPTSLAVAPAHRGGTAWKITVGGGGGRAFAGQKVVTPVDKMIRVIQALEAYDRQRVPACPPAFYESDSFLPTYVQQVQGGGQLFAEAIGAPPECTLSIWIEEHPGTDAETSARQMMDFVNASLAGDPGFDGRLPEYTRLFRFIPGSAMDPGHPFLETLRGSFGSAGVDFRLEGAKFACDTYVFNLHSPTPALTLGPRGGNAHAADEYVLAQDVIDLARIYARSIMDWCR